MLAITINIMTIIFLLNRFIYSPQKRFSFYIYSLSSFMYMAQLSLKNSQFMIAFSYNKKKYCLEFVENNCTIKTVGKDGKTNNRNVN